MIASLAIIHKIYAYTISPYPDRTYNYHILLSVPENSFDLYCNTPYWQDFHSINGIIGAGDSSLEVASSNTKIWTQSQILYLESEKEIEEVKIYNINGICTWNETINSRKWQFVTTELPVGLFLIEVVTIDGDKEIYKFSKL